MNKSIYLGLAILWISKIVMYAFWYDYVKTKYGGKVKLCYMDTNSFMIYIKPKDIDWNIAKDVETRFDTSNYKLNRSLSKGKNNKVIDLIKDKLGANVMEEFAALREKT